ncbi:MAG: hypothetical protein GX488_08270 [Clostridiales bacterium]|nr:hypothetical protein [Clostridiales bacterium]
MMKTENMRKEELQEMARIILCEISGSAKLRAQFPSFGDNEKSRQYQLLEALSFNDKIAAMGRTFESSDHCGLKSLQLENGDFYPRRTRREFLEQRIERRTNRTGSLENSAVNETDKRSKIFSETIRSEDSSVKGRLPEKLSDAFRRDARRYDGAFERY